jgi:hypothetical protein
MDVMSLRRVFPSICGIGWLDPNSDWDQGKSAGAMSLPKLNIRATGFLLTSGAILTAGHVLRFLVRKKKVSLSQHLVAVFVDPTGPSDKASIYIIRGFTHYTLFGRTPDDPDDASPGLDYGVLVLPKHLRSGAPPPLETAPKGQQHVLDQVIVIGYYAPSLTLNNPRLAAERFGPMVLSGRIAAISPCALDSSFQPAEYLLDITAAGGVSGSPVLDISGRVIAMAVAGIEHEVRNYNDERIGMLPLDVARALVVNPITAASVAESVKDIDALPTEDFAEAPPLD